MKLDFVVNKYLLMWHLLYQSSISAEVHALKLDLWNRFRKEYSIIHKEKKAMLEELDDYIPFDDSLFDRLENSIEYRKLKQETKRYRLAIMEIWDKNYKTYIREINKIMKCQLKLSYTVCVIHPSFNLVEIEEDKNMITIGKKISYQDHNNFLTYLVYKIIKNEFQQIKAHDREFIDVVVELAITNELYTRITKESKYHLGKKQLREIKEKVYPYWLMYLGVERSQMEKYMIRDNIFFSIADYKEVEELKHLDIFEFIQFILKNKRSLMRKKKVAIEEIEVL